MPYQLDIPSMKPTTGDVRERIATLLENDGPRYRRLWNYYRNPMTTAAAATSGERSGSERPYRVAQEWGLPSRITGYLPGSSQAADGVARKEIVVENDIAWRIDTLIDYLFGKSPIVTSTASDPSRRAMIEQILRTAIDHNGGIVFFQQLALIGAVHGFVDVLVKFDADEARKIASEMQRDAAGDRSQETQTSAEASSNGGTGPSQRSMVAASVSSDSANVPPHAGTASRIDEASTNDETAAAAVPRAAADEQADDRAPAPLAGAGPSDASIAHADRLTRIARCIRFEIVEPARALPFLAAEDWRAVEGYAQVYSLQRASSDGPSRLIGKRTWLDRFLGRIVPSGSSIAGDAGESLILDVISPMSWQRYENEKLIAHGTNALGEIPLVHIQNNASPFEYSGTSDVEPLVPLQDELNTRLSDRAHRITMQSFKMYLGKGIENFGQLPVAPGRMWMTDNDQAEVIEFGGDSANPSEDAHIDGIREALDKTSSVSPIAAGALKARIGRLTSAAALRVTLLALLAKTERKRTTYGGGIIRMCELALGWLDVAGLFETSEAERRVQLSWPSPIPQNDGERLAEAESKLRIGVSRETVLRELGY